MSPYQSPQLPAYRLHRATGQAVVTLCGHDHYLGKHGSPESRAKYRRLIAEFVKGGFRMPSPDQAGTYPVSKLCDDFLTFAEQVYRHRDGSSTGTIENVRRSMRHLFLFAAGLDASQFGPRALVGVRDVLIEGGLARVTVNARIQIIRHAFKWAAEQERIPASIYHGLLTVSGLRRGRSLARETNPVRPVPDADIQAALPFMPEPVRDMVSLQLLTGARPGEITDRPDPEVPGSYIHVGEGDIPRCKDCNGIVDRDNHTLIRLWPNGNALTKVVINARVAGGAGEGWNGARGGRADEKPPEAWGKSELTTIESRYGSVGTRAIVARSVFRRAIAKTR